MKIGLLGLLEVTDDHGQPVVIRGQRPRAVLAVLALGPERPVTMAQLIRALWGARPPGAAKESIHVFVHQLRKTLGQDAVRTHGASYQLQLPADQVDAVRFGRLVDQAHAAAGRGALHAAWEGFERALGLWRGVALADFSTEPFAEAERARLEERRLAAVEAQHRVGLALGQHAELAGELEALVTEHGLREGLWELLMLARYRCGRQAAALEAYQEARRRLMAHGLEPGERLQHLQRAILSQDPALDLPGQHPEPPQPPPARRPPATTPSPPTARPAPGATPLAPAPDVPVREERRTVTVMMVRAPNGLPSDPEDVRAHTTGMVKQVAEVVARYGGVVQADAAGRLLVVFGAVHTHEDDAERAVRAALDIRTDAEAAGTPVRIGVATGDVVVTSTSTGDNPAADGDGGLVAVDGDVLHAAAALEAAARPGSVVVGARTYRATGRTIRYRPAASEAVGREVGAWEALAPTGRTGAFKLTLGDAVATPLIERERELAILDGVLTRFLRDRQPQLLTVVSEPGLGKTRLVAELGRMVDQAPELVTWRAGQSVAFGGASAGALAEIIKAHVGILDTDAPDVVGDRLGQAAAEVVTDPAEAAWVTHQLRTLLGRSPPTASQPHTQELFAGWARFLAATAARRPMVVVFEDLHWAEDPLVAFIDRLIEQVEMVPLLVVCTARPEFLDQRPRWGGGKRDAVTISLTPLSPAGAGELLDALLGRTRLAGATRQALQAAAGGNPLYLEEYARMLTEGRSKPAALTGADVPVPDSIQQLIAARLDLLPGKDRQLLQDAAVIGETGWVGALAAVSGRDRDQAETGLRRLQRRQLLRQVRTPSIPGETEYAFRHTLIREVAYQQLLRAARAEKHQRVARWIQSLNPDPGERAELLAHHDTRALQFAQAAGRQTAALRERAVHALRLAGDRARALGAFAAAARAYRHALDLHAETDSPPDPELLYLLGLALLYGEHRGEPELTQARERWQAAGRHDRVAMADADLANLAALRGDLGDVGAHTARLANVTVPLTPETTNAAIMPAVDLLLADEPHQAYQAAARLHELAVERRVPVAAGAAHCIMGEAMLQLGDLRGEALARRGITLLEAERYPGAGMTWYGLACWLWWLGELDRCQTVITQAGQSLTSRRTLESLAVYTAGIHYAAGRWTAAAALVGQVAAGGADVGHVLPWCHTLRGRILLGGGDLEAAAAAATEALAAAEQMPGRRDRHAAAALHARVLAAAGDHSAAATQARAVLDDIRAHPAGACVTEDLALVIANAGVADLPDRLPLSRWHAAVAAHLAGDMEHAVRAYSTLGAPVTAALARLQAARELLAAGNAEAAHQVLTPAVGLWRTCGAHAYLGAAEELLAGG